MSESTIRGMLWTTAMLVLILVVLSFVPGCTATGKSALAPWNWKLPGAKPQPKPSDPNFNSDSQEVLGVKLTYEALQRVSFVVPIALGAIVLGTVVMFAGHGIGIKILGAGFVALTVYFGIVQYTQWIALLGFLGVISIMGYVLFVKSRGWKQTIQSVEALMDHFPEQKERMIQILEKNQKSKTTRKIVKKIKNDLKYVPLARVPLQEKSLEDQGVSRTGFAIMDDETDQKGRPI